MSDWQLIDGHKNHYQVSRDGRVRRINGAEIGQWPNHNGYLMVRLSRPRAQYRVHRLVAAAFVSNPHRHSIVNHLDHDRTNNSAANLEWCSQHANLMHAQLAGRMQRDYWKGRRSPNARLTNEDVRDIRAMYAAGGISWAAIGKRFDVSKRCIGRVIKGESYADVR